MIYDKYKKMYYKFKKKYMQRHIDPWHEINEQDLDNLYEQLIKNMDIVDDNSFDYFINYIIKRLSGPLDAHTEFGMKTKDFLPIRFKFVESELFVSKPSELYCYKLISINDISINTIIEEFEKVITYGTEGWRLNKLERALFIKRKLFSIPSLRSENEVIFKLENLDGNTIKKIYYKDKLYNQIEEVDKNATYEIKNNTLIFNYSSLKISEVEKLISSIKKIENEYLSNINKIIIDLRGNTGGNSRLNKYLIDFLKNQKDKDLIVLTDYRIFSGGTFTLIDLIKIGAVTIGEGIGTPINAYGSGGISYTDNDYMFRISGGFCLYNEDKTSLICIKDKEEFKKYVTKEMKVPIIFKPDIIVHQTKEDFINNIDAALEYALFYEKKENYMKKLYIVEDKEITDFNKIEKYNEDFINNSPSFKPFITKENFDNFLKEVEEKKEGIGNSGIKEIFFWFMEGNDIIGSGSIRLNPEIDEYTEKVCGHLFYQIIPSKRGKGYGSILCHLLLEKMYELGFKEAVISCFDTNIGSRKIIENNGGEFIEFYYDETEENPDFIKNRRYRFDIEKSLSDFDMKNMRKIK